MRWDIVAGGVKLLQVVGALINAVFLIALCFSITVEAIKRFLVIGINVVIVVTIIVNIAKITFIIIINSN